MSQIGRIDSFQFAHSGSGLTGRLGAEQLSRLADQQVTLNELSFELRGGTNRSGKLCLHLAVKGSLTLVCQRCMGPLDFPLDFDAELEIAASKEEIELADDEVDRVLGSSELSVPDLVEDEVMLELPMVPRHESCGASNEAGKRGRASPFEALARLKIGSGR